PIIVSHRVKLIETKGSIKIDAPIKFGMIKIGLTDHMFTKGEKHRSMWNSKGDFNFKGTASFGNGIKIRNWGTIEFGNKFSSTSTLLIDCKKAISFGDEVMIGWGCTIMDTDNHFIKVDGKTINPKKEIKIGNKVWICANCSVMKGVTILDNTVVASNSVLTQSINKVIKNNVLIGGYPARILRENITWEK
ncbi:acyltransferase, partial [Bacillaceae bacterium Marseille-Q3522]|nr:acyltransferase [Bacillaceae bacterium Marseille-Q3522]